MSRKPPRGSWHQVKGRWACSLGTRGTRVRLFENAKGVYYRDVYVPGQGKDRRKSLETTDRAEAERLGKELLASLLLQTESANSGLLTLKHLWERYSKEAPDFLDNDPRTRKEDAAHVQVLLAFFGDDCDVRHLTANDVKAFTAKRMAGGIPMNSGKTSQPVRARTPEVEIRILKTMLHWATAERLRGGQRLLATNPLAGVRGKGESNPIRPVATWERFQAIRGAMQQLARESGKQRWVRLEFALVLAEATGRRIGSIRQLEWRDFDLDSASIRWRAEADKKRKESLVPMPPALLEEVRRFRMTLGGAFGGLVFPSPTDPQRPLGREVFQHGLADAVAKAKLPARGGWHSFRRKFASERKHHPQADLLAVGGWSKNSAAMVTECYQFADSDTMLAVMSEPLKRTERAVIAQ